MPKILVGTPNYTGFFPAIVTARFMEMYSIWKKEYGFDNVKWRFILRQFVHFARNQLAREAIEGGFDYVLWLDDDAIIDPSFLPRLIEHDVDIVMVPYFLRRPPYWCGVLRAESGNIYDVATYKNLRMEDLNQGLIEVDGGGTHCMLVKTSVFEAMVKDGVYDHWFILAPKGGTEDMYFCMKAKDQGFKVYCDSDIEAGHIGDPQIITQGHHKAWMENYGDQLMNKVVTPDDVQRGYISTDARSAGGLDPRLGLQRDDSVAASDDSPVPATSANGKPLSAT